MRILVTGVAGFLGSHLADALIAAGHQVVGIDNLIGGELDNVPAGVDFHQCDCNDFELVRRVSAGCQIFYHCAATAYEGLSVFSPHIVTQNIVGSLFNSSLFDFTEGWIYAFGLGVTGGVVLRSFSAEPVADRQANLATATG